MVGPVHVERTRVAWVDTDAGGRIHFTAAFRWAEAAETALGRSLGLLQEWGDLPRRAVEAEYLQVLRFEDEIEVELRPALLDLDLAHPELLHLAGHGHRERVDEAHVVRDLEQRDLAAAEFLQLVLVELGALLEDDPGADRLAVALVGDADHLHVLDRRMRVQELLDLARVDVLAAADDHVLDSADDVDVPLVV